MCNVCVGGGRKGCVVYVWRKVVWGKVVLFLHGE